jgi:hypothetical protein
MSASPPPHWPVRPPHHRTGPASRPGADHGPAGRTSDGRTRGDLPTHLRHTRPTLRTAVDVVARFGTAVTLASLLVVTAAALTAVDAPPSPAGVTTNR